MILMAQANQPIPAYHFIVNWGGTRLGFTEVSGLSIETEVIEYREGSSPNSIKTKMPGLRKYTNVVLKRGVYAGDNEFFQWINTINGSKVDKRDVVISLLDEDHQPVLTWKLYRAWPVKLDVSPLRAEASEVVIETLELAHEGLTIEA